MIKTWPFPTKIININPDDFHSFSRSVVNSETRHEEELNTVLKPVRFLLHTIIQGMKPDERDHLIKRIVKSVPALFEVPQLFEIDEKNLLTVFASARGAMNFAQQIIKNVKLHNMQLSLHAGPVTISQDGHKETITGTTVTEINAISSHGLTGLIYCSEQVVAILAMERQDLLFHPVGRIDVGEEWKAIDVYTVDLLQ